ncbi:hypothetical protein R70006_05049 [Paraburkholderia domus]|uniref:hypothetical protein n=1 Tax=Paraburkholderia domus TaxID=2793075 RepID=UPI0019135298|nr:hypothetical protein [Paraburkholderia domus]MBK5051714.1 hypothetical protein [Burkholderia sp. R-70006]CAE6795401.1 hypothetical protein R70006_05049 [Paraburkholderia domus]
MNTPLTMTRLSREEILASLASLGEDPTAARVEALHASIDAATLPAGERADTVRAAVDAARVRLDAAPGEAAKLSGSEVEINAQMYALVNSSLGYCPVKVVRDVTGEGWCTTPRIEGDRVFEVQYTDGPFHGQYTEVAERHLSRSYPQGDPSATVAVDRKAVAQASERSLVVDGTDEFGNYAGDANKPHFVVFDIDQQRKIAGPFGVRAEAEQALALVSVKERVFRERYPDAEGSYRAIREELLFICGSLRSVAPWATDFLKASSSTVQEAMFLTDVFPFLEKHGFPAHRTEAMQAALREFRIAAANGGLVSNLQSGSGQPTLAGNRIAQFVDAAQVLDLIDLHCEALQSFPASRIALEQLAGGIQELMKLPPLQEPALRPEGALAVLQESDPRPIVPLDPHRPLYDEAGRECRVINFSDKQVVTNWLGVFGVWDRKTGECLIANSEGTRLSNERPSTEWVARRREDAIDILSSMHADAAIDRARDASADTAQRSPSPDM